MKDLITKTAEIHNVSTREIRREIKNAIKLGMKSKDPVAVRFWSQFGGKTPTPEEFLRAVVIQ